MNMKCSPSDLQNAWSLVSHEQLSVRTIARLTGVSRGTAHIHRQLYRHLRVKFPRLRLQKLSLLDARALNLKKG